MVTNDFKNTKDTYICFRTIGGGGGGLVKIPLHKNSFIIISVGTRFSAKQ